MKLPAAFANVRVVTMTLLTLFAASACGNYDSVDPASPELTSLTVTLSAPVIEVGDITFATAGGRDQYGSEVSTVTVTWTSSEPKVATVNSTTGVILGIAQGTARITATADGERTAAQTVTVIDAAAVAVDGGASKRDPQ